MMTYWMSVRVTSLRSSTNRLENIGLLVVLDTMFGTLFDELLLNAVSNPSPPRILAAGERVGRT